jgi:hypothetical protein
MSEADVVKSDYVVDPDTGLLVKRGNTNIDRHAVSHSSTWTHLRKCSC